MKKILAVLFVMVFVVSVSATIMVFATDTQSQTGAISESASLLFGVSNSSSLNWAGYAVTGNNVTNVSGSFTVPSASSSTSGGPNANSYTSLLFPAGSNIGLTTYKNGHVGGGSGGGSSASYAAFWVGIDGYNSNTVEQAGVLMEVQNGVASYSVWYEFYPAAPVYATWHPSPGNNITVYVNYTMSNNTFVATVLDTTLGEKYVSPFTTVSGAARTSAEWITEAPASDNRILPLADFGTAYFGPEYLTNSPLNYATVGGHSGEIGSFSNVYRINMVQRNGSLKAETSALYNNDSFYVTWVSS